MKLSDSTPRVRFIGGRVFYDYGDRLLPRITGGDGETNLEALPEDLRTRVDGVGDATDEDLASLEGELVEFLDSIVDPVEAGEADATDEVIAQAEAARAAIQMVRDDAGRRYDEAETAEAEATERRARLVAIRDETAGEEEEGETEGTETDETETEGEQETETAGEGETEGTETTAGEQETETTAETEGEGTQARAAGAAATAPARRSSRPQIGRVAARRGNGPWSQRRSAAPTSGLSHLPAAMVAGADLNNFSLGENIPDLEQLAEAIVDRASALEGVSSGVNGQKFRVARMRSEYPEERRLSDTDARLSTQRMDAALSPEERARVATGGLCAPLTPDYSQIGLSDAARPAWEAVPHFGADRGGVRWVPPPKFSRGTGLTGYKAGIDDWTVTNDETPGSDGPATKPYTRVDCEAEQSEVIEATTKRLRIGNFYAMTFRERVQAIMDILDAEYAAHSETKLLDKMATLATADVSTAQGFGAARDFLSKLDLLVAGFENRWRMAENHAPLRLFVPDWIHDLARADLTRAMNTGRTLEEQLAVTDAQVDAFIRARNITPTFLVDGETGANQTFGPQADGAIDSWPNNGDAIGYLFHDGAYRIIDAGTLDIGLYRDSTLNNTNDAELFMEEFWNVIFQGWEALRVTFSLCPNGTSAGTSSYDPCTVGS